MTALCRMTNERVKMPCSYAACPLFGDCLVAYEKATVKPKTNADHIRSMTDEELADYMSDHAIDDFCYIICGGECKAIATFNKTPFQRCREIVSDWLKQPFDEVRK